MMKCQLFVHLRLQEIKENRKPFGSIHMIIVGDPYQLKQVTDQWIFMNLSAGYGLLVTNLWQQYFTMHQLTEIMCQKDDEPFASLRRQSHWKRSAAIKYKTYWSRKSKLSEFGTASLPNKRACHSSQQKLFLEALAEKQLSSYGLCCWWPATKCQKSNFSNCFKTAGLVYELQIATVLHYAASDWDHAKSKHN